MSQQNRYIYEFGPFRLDRQKRLLYRGDEIVPLKPKAFETLLALVERGGQLIEKNELMKRVWPDTVVEEGNLTFNISTLRKALGDDPRRHQYIVTIPGEGYQFVAGVRATFDEVSLHERSRITVEEVEETAAERELGGTNGTNATAPGKQIAPTASTLTTTAKSVAVTPFAPGRRSHLVFVVLALLVAGTASAFGIYWLVNHRQSGERALAAPFREMTITRLTNTGTATKATLSPDGKYFVHVTDGAEGQSLWVRQVAVATASQQIVAPRHAEYWGLTFSPDGNYVYCVVFEDNSGEASLYKVPVLGGATTKLPITPDSPISFSPDGLQITFFNTSSSGSQVVVAAADGTGAREVARRVQPDYFCAIHNGPAWSPDGKTIVATLAMHDEMAEREAVLAVNLVDGAERIITQQRWFSIENLSWLHDGSGMLATVYEQATSPAQVWHISYPEGEARRITNDLNQYDGISLTADTRAFVTVQTSAVSHVWVASLDNKTPSNVPHGPLIDENRSGQIASEVGDISGVAWTPEGNVVYMSRASGMAELWIMGRDGSQPRQLTTSAQADLGLAVSPDGRYIVFASARSGVHNIWRADADGGNLTKLTNGNGDIFPHISPDSRWVVFQRGSGLVPPTLWKVSMDGGEAVQLTDMRVQKPRVSPDGKLIAYYYLDAGTAKSDWSMAVVPIEGGRRVKSFKFPAIVSSRLVRWTPDGQSLAYLDSRDGASNIWLQPLDGTPPKQLTDFKAEQILTFDWSPDGRSLAVVRAARASDVVLVQHAGP